MLTKEQLLAAPEADYMNEDQRAFFKDMLEKMSDDIHASLVSAKEQLSQFQYEADELDKAAIEEDRRLQLRFLERQTKLLPKIEQALKRIQDEEFGYCEVTGEPIGLPRLLVRPTATLCAEEKQRQEQQERNYRDS